MSAYTLQHKRSGYYYAGTTTLAVVRWVKNPPDEPRFNHHDAIKAQRRLKRMGMPVDVVALEV